MGVWSNYSVVDGMGWGSLYSFLGQRFETNNRSFGRDDEGMIAKIVQGLCRLLLELER